MTRKIREADSVHFEFCDKCDGLHMLLVDRNDKPFAVATLEMEEIVELAVLIREHREKSAATFSAPAGLQ